MLTLDEQIVFLKESRKQKTKFLEHVSKQFGEINKQMFTRQIGHTIFCYDSILQSILELQALKSKTHGK